jgi:hypothetical protein
MPQQNILFSPSRPSFFIFSAQPKLAIHIKSRNPNTLLNPLSHQSTPAATAATAPCSRRHPPQLLSIVTALFFSPSSTLSPTVAVGSARADALRLCLSLLRVASTSLPYAAASLLSLPGAAAWSSRPATPSIPLTVVLLVAVLAHGLSRRC